jgi:hypothetical protein
MKHTWDIVGIVSGIFSHRNSINVSVFTVNKQKGGIEICGYWCMVF